MEENKNGLKKENKNEALRKELLAEIGSLRVQFREIISRYQANLEAEMVWCINNLTAVDPEELPKSAKDKQALTAMIDELKRLKLKSEKGRFKDIKKINKLIENISLKLSE